MTLKSFKRWKVIQLFSREIFKKFNTCFAQNQETYKRLFLLGAKKVKYIGNLKFTTRKKAKFDTLNKQKLNFYRVHNQLIVNHFHEHILHPHFDFRVIVDNGMTFVSLGFATTHVGTLARHHD